MSNIKTQKFYWLKLTKDFFNKEEVKLIEKEEDGEKYICFYLKMLLMSVNNDGVLTLKEDIPYTLKMLSSYTDTELEIAEKAMELLVLYKLAYIREDNVFCLTEVANMTGAETTHAATKRKQRGGTDEEEVDEEEDEFKEEGKKRRTKKKIKKEKSEEILKATDISEITDGHLEDKDKTLSGHLVDNDETLSGHSVDNVQQSIENRDKSIENRDKRLDNHPLLLQKDEEGSEEAADDKKSYFNIAKKLEQCNFGLPSPHMVNKLLADVEIYGEKFVSDAIEAADEYGVRKYPYVKSILDTWKTNGKGEKGVGRNNKKNNGKNYSKIYDLSKWEKGSDEPFDGQDIETEY